MGAAAKAKASARRAVRSEIIAVTVQVCGWYCGGIAMLRELYT